MMDLLKLFLFFCSHRAVHRKRRHRHHYKMNNEFPSSLHLLAKRESSSSLLRGSQESLANFATEEIQQLCHMLRPPDIDERQDNFSDVFQYSAVLFFFSVKISCTGVSQAKEC